MKYVYIVIGTILIIFITIQLFALNSQQKTERQPYTIVEEYADFEVRKYESALYTSVKLPSNKYENASRKGFSILAEYIFGGNDKNQQIAMTSPVTMTLEDSITMLFMVPKGLSKENLPKPNESSIEFKEEPEKKIAAIEFGGWANDRKIETYKQKLTAALERENIEHKNNFQFLGYNAPYEMINRKNEIVVELQ